MSIDRRARPSHPGSPGPYGLVPRPQSNHDVDMDSDMANFAALAADLTRVIIEQLAPITAKIEELRTSLAVLDQRVGAIAKLESERKELEIRVRHLEDKFNHLHGAGGVAGVGGKWIAGILGSVFGALFVAGVIAFVTKVLH